MKSRLLAPVASAAMLAVLAVGAPAASAAGSDVLLVRTCEDVTHFETELDAHPAIGDVT